jgi:hypothetical protein
MKSKTRNKSRAAGPLPHKKVYTVRNGRELAYNETRGVLSLAINFETGENNFPVGADSFGMLWGEAWQTLSGAGKTAGVSAVFDAVSPDALLTPAQAAEYDAKLIDWGTTLSRPDHGGALSRVAMAAEFVTMYLRVVISMQTEGLLDLHAHWDRVMQFCDVWQRWHFELHEHGPIYRQQQFVVGPARGRQRRAQSHDKLRSLTRYYLKTAEASSHSAAAAEIIESLNLALVQEGHKAVTRDTLRKEIAKIRSASAKP